MLGNVLIGVALGLLLTVFAIVLWPVTTNVLEEEDESC